MKKINKKQLTKEEYDTLQRIVETLEALRLKSILIKEEKKLKKQQ